MMKVEHVHTMPFMERMMLSGWMGPWAMMAATAAKRMERKDRQTSTTVSVKGAGGPTSGGGGGGEPESWTYPLA